MLMRRRCLPLLLGAILLTATTACEDAIVKKDPPESLPGAASMKDGVEVWDLRQRPSPGEVGIGDGEQTAVYETRPARPVRLRLGSDETVELPTRYIAYSTILSRDDEVVSVDVKTATMRLDETVERFESVLDQLDLPTTSVAGFERRAEGATGYDSVVSDRVSARYGTLDLGVLARYSPHSERGSVALIGNWLKKP